MSMELVEKKALRDSMYLQLRAVAVTMRIDNPDPDVLRSRLCSATKVLQNATFFAIDCWCFAKVP